MIEASNLLKELADQKSDLGKLSQMDPSSHRENGANIYDQPLSKPDGLDSAQSAIDKPWYEEAEGRKDDLDDDLLDAQREHQYTDNRREENNEPITDNSEVNASTEGEGTDSPEKRTSYIDEYGADGGRYKDMKDEGWGHNTEPPTEVHHMPANSASELPTDDGPCIVMDYEDHRETASCGNSREAQEYRAKQKELIEQGKFREAFQMDVDDIRDKFGDKYNEAISKAEEYLDQLEKEGRI